MLGGVIVEHEGPLRVSGIQSGVFSGTVGSTVGQQPFRDGLRVREAQPTQWGWTPRYGVLEVRARMELTARSMASVWMVGIEDEPQRSGEICVFEVFGDAISPAGPAVGMGIHPFRDPALRDDFAAPRLPVDVTGFHVYAADWRPGGVDFFVDGDHVRTVEQAPDYPMQMMIGVFDSWRMRRQTSKPSILGRLPSSRTMSGFSLSQRCSACWPSTAARTL